MESSLPQQWGALCALVALLGARHGLDADHLAAIDGLARCHGARPALARRCGLLFSLGHGLVVVATALVASTVAAHWRVPAWMDAFGAGVSIAFLLALGALNLRSVFVAPRHAVVAPVGIKGRLLLGAGTGRGAPGVLLVGALFALSFDTLSQALLFTMAATRLGGWQQALGVGLIFTAGMMATDGLNGWWIARLLQRADRLARVASRTMGLAVGSLSLIVAAWGLLRLAAPETSAWTEGREAGIGIAAVAVMAGSFLVARLLAQAETVPAPQASNGR